MSQEVIRIQTTVGLQIIIIVESLINNPDRGSSYNRYEYLDHAQSEMEYGSHRRQHVVRESNRYHDWYQ